MIRPPGWADALLRLVLPRGVKGLTILADLHEEFADQVETLGPGAARRRYVGDTMMLALRLAPGRVREAARDWRGGDGMLNEIWTDTRVGLRSLLRTPGLSAIAVLTIALGIALTTHTWSSVYGSVLRGLPVPDPDRLLALQEFDLDFSEYGGDLPYLDYLDFQRDGSLGDLGAFYRGTVNLAGEDGPPERLAGAFVSANTLSLLRVRPHLGRTFAPGEDGPGGSTAVLSWRLWRDRFGSDPEIVGRTIRANGSTTEIIGVMPEGFRFPFDEDIWLPLAYDAATSDRRSEWVEIVGRLPAGMTWDDATAAAAAVGARIAEAFPEENRDLGHRVSPFAELFMPPQITAVLFLMLASALGVLFIACANVANLLLARASTRTSEVAVRTALGASRGRVVRQLLVEAGVLSTLGAVVGIAMAWYGAELYQRSIAGIEKPFWIDVTLEWTAVLFALGMTVVAALAAGIWPALRASGTGFNAILRDDSRGTSSLRMGRFSHALVVGEIAVSCGLLIGAGLMIKSVANMRNTDLGFDSEGVLTGRAGLFATDYPEAGDRQDFWRTLRTELDGHPEVESVALATQLPGLGGRQWSVEVEGETYDTPRDAPIANGTIVTDRFFETFGIDLLSGRDFYEGESWDATTPAAIVNVSFVERVLGGGDPLGRRVRVAGDDAPWAVIVGVVPDVYVGGGTGGIGNDRMRREHLYLAAGPYDLQFLSVAMATRGSPSALAPVLRETVAGIDSNLPVYRLAPLDEAIRESTWAFGLFGSLFTVVGLAALFLASVGLYGVMAFSVSQRRRELGVRMALGADSRSLMAMVLRRGAGQLVLGTLLGLGVGYAIAIPMSFVTYQVDPADPVVYGAILATLGLTGLLATFVPARAATRADPAESMRPR